MKSIDIENCVYQLIKSLENCDEYGKLAKDSVSNVTADADNTLLRNVEKIIVQLFEIPWLKNCNADDRNFQIGRKLCAYIFKRVHLNEDDNIIHFCVKSNGIALMERILDILRKFELCGLLNWPNIRQETCVHLACSGGRKNMLEKVLIYGANVNAINSNGDTALHIAIQNGFDVCVSVLLNTALMDSKRKIDIDLNVFNNSGYTPLHLASKENNLNIVKMLSHKAAQKHCLSIFDAMDKKHGNNALHIAIESDAFDVADYLIMNGRISPLKRNRSGHTASYLARNFNAMKLADSMEQYENSIDNDDDFSHNDDEAADLKKEYSSESQATGKVIPIFGLISNLMNEYPMFLIEIICYSDKTFFD